MVQFKLLTTADLEAVQAICERRILTSIGNFNQGFGRMEDLVETVKVIEVLGMCRPVDAPSGGDVVQAPRARKAA